jgi:CRP-like cAMP-binding protein
VRKGDLVLATLKAEETRTKLTKELDFDNPFFGEMAILDAAPRMASVRTTEPCKLLLLRADYGEERNGDRFRDFLHLVPDFKARLRETKKTRRQQASLQEKATDAGARAAAEVFHSTGILQRRWRLKAKHTQRGSEVVQPKYCVGTEPERMPSQ